MAPAESSSRSLVGAVLSRRWRLVQRLGAGGMGEVYAADPVEGGTRVAVKVLRPEYLAEPGVLSRFLEEASTCLRLVHPNIVRMMECASAEDGSPYLVMELLEGVPLGAYTANGGRVPVAQAVPILQGILAGLASAHARGIVHRDLKPDNVFLTRAPEGTFVVKVLDFGIAKVMDAAGGMGSRTRTGMLLGTLAYMSPEQIQSARDVDQRADLWSAGVMFYEMLTGREVFPAPTDYARLAAVLGVEPEPLARGDGSLAPLAPFVARALKKNREERFPSALEMAHALSAAVPHLAQRLDGGMGMVTPPSDFLLSRLPDVPSFFAASRPISAAAEPAPLPPRPPPALPRASAAQVLDAVRAAGGTLASRSGSQAPAADPPPFVMMASAQTVGERLPSKDLPMIVRASGRVRRSVPAWTVVFLVLMALGAGFLLGWAFARMT